MENADEYKKLGINSRKFSRTNLAENIPGNILALENVLQRIFSTNNSTYGRTSQNTKWSSAKYIVIKLPDEGTCVPWVQNGGIHGHSTVYKQRVLDVAILHPGNTHALIGKFYNYVLRRPSFREWIYGDWSPYI